MKHITEDELLEKLHRAVRESGSQLAFASQLGFSRQYLNDILKRGRRIGPKVLKAMGYKRVVVYVKDTGE